MNREIKFRVWNEKEKVYKCYAPLHTILNSKDRKITLVQDESICLEQYTGLVDKNGVEIYEGDVLDCYDDGNMGVPYKVVIETIFDIYDLQPFVFEVIGNVHKNEKQNEKNN